MAILQVSPDVAPPSLSSEHSAKRSPTLTRITTLAKQENVLQRSAHGTYVRDAHKPETAARRVAAHASIVATHGSGIRSHLATQDRARACLDTEGDVE